MVAWGHGTSLLEQCSCLGLWHRCPLLLHGGTGCGGVSWWPQQAVPGCSEVTSSSTPPSDTARARPRRSAHHPSVVSPAVAQGHGCSTLFLAIMWHPWPSHGVPGCRTVSLTVSWCLWPLHGACGHHTVSQPQHSVHGHLSVPLAVAWCPWPLPDALDHLLVPLVIAQCPWPSHGACGHLLMPVAISQCP